MAAKRILLTLAAASLALVAWLAWKPTSFPHPYRPSGDAGPRARTANYSRFLAKA